MFVTPCTSLAARGAARIRTGDGGFAKRSLRPKMPGITRILWTAQHQAQQSDRETGRVAATRATQATLSENTHPLVATSYNLRTWAMMGDTMRRRTIVAETGLEPV